MSKFQELNFYKNRNDYNLLPFKFENLNETEVVMTNMVGEFIVVHKNSLSEIVEKKVDATSLLYSKLRSKHFIFEEGDQAPIELLALKARTKLNNLANFTNLHIFVATLRCDHSCQYCQVSRQSEDKEKFDMSFETASKSLDLVFRSPNRSIKIEFQGGEPILNWPLIEYVVNDAKRRNLIEGRDLQFVITSTLSLITDEMLEFCRLNNIYLSSSLDGPEDLHNKNRPRPGRDSHKRFVEGLTKARNVLGIDNVSALMTTSPSSLDRVREIIDEYVRHGFNGIFLRHLSPYGFAIKTKSYASYNSERWLEFYKEGLAYILELNRNGVEFVEYYSSIILTKMLTVRDPGFVDLSNPSGAGISAVVFNYDGNVYASDESRMLKEMGDDSFCIGNVHNNTYEEIFTSEKLLDALEHSFTLSAPMCNDCAFEPWCGAEPVFHHGTVGDVLGRKPESEFCKRQTGVSKHLINLMQNDANTKRIFMKWVAGC